MENQNHKMNNAGNGLCERELILIVMGDKFLIVGEESYKYQKEESRMYSVVLIYNWDISMHSGYLISRYVDIDIKHRYADKDIGINIYMFINTCK